MQKMKSSQHGTFYILPSMIKPTKRHSNDTWNQTLRNNTNLSLKVQTDCTWTVSSIITFISQSNTDGDLKCYSVAATATLASREEGNYTQNCKFADDDDIK